MYISLNILNNAVVENPDGSKQSVQGLLKLNINVDNINFIIKPLGQPALVVSNGVNFIATDNIPENIIGLHRFQIKEGGFVWLSPKHIVYYASTDEIGIYLIGFTGGNRVSIKATGQEVHDMISVSIITTP